ncbi:TOBE domain-containing protein [Maribrevibacterium harenarium]
MVLVHLACGSDQLVARLTSRSANQLNLQVGNKVWAQIKSVAVVR